MSVGKNKTIRSETLLPTQDGHHSHGFIFRGPERGEIIPSPSSSISTKAGACPIRHRHHAPPGRGKPPCISGAHHQAHLKRKNPANTQDTPTVLLCCSKKPKWNTHCVKRSNSTNASFTVPSLPLHRSRHTRTTNHPPCFGSFPLSGKRR